MRRCEASPEAEQDATFGATGVLFAVPPSEAPRLLLKNGELQLLAPDDEEGRCEAGVPSMTLPPGVLRTLASQSKPRSLSTAERRPLRWASAPSTHVCCCCC